ncbi:DUF4097 family beta strand repeat-containing protein [Phytohabitans houttuyneae]|uniref:DUF4097 family beta strand repeat-containing protein n=1 Tax=Phytohabitans houttuyneae TaxID=1076126 RepID=UPI0015632D5A|nr:hypothetical protein [Phytohabitans houttuyneae]
MPARLSTLGLVTAATAALFAATGCGLTDGETSSTVETYDFTEIKTIDLRGEAGAVEVVATAGGVRVTERREYSGTAPKTSRRTDGGTLFLRDDGCDTQWRIRKNCETTYRIEAPAGISLKINVDAAPVTITGITGPLDVTTDVGAINGTGLAGNTRVRTDVGDVDLRYGAAPDSLDATNDVGSTTVYLPSTAAYRFDVRVDVGDTTIDLPNRADANHRIKLTADVGDITVHAA